MKIKKKHVVVLDILFQFPRGLTTLEFMDLWEVRKDRLGWWDRLINHMPYALLRSMESQGLLRSEQELRPGFTDRVRYRYFLSELGNSKLMEYCRAQIERRQIEERH